MDLMILPLAVATTLTFMLLAGRAVRRLMGVRVSATRAALAGALVLALQGPIVRSATGGGYQDANAYSAVGIMALSLTGATVAAMVALVVAEALVPTGSLSGPVGMWRDGRGRLARARRYVRIARTVTRHGLGRYTTRRSRRHGNGRDRLARSLRLALEEGGPAFVKFGQLLATRHDLLPAEFTAELARLQDRVPADDWAVVEPLLCAELGPLESVFTRIDPAPLAAASVAQVHSARLLDGTEVVVKVQRPGALATMSADLDILKRVSRCLRSRTEWAERIDLATLVDAYARSLRDEFDFELEASNAAVVAASVEATEMKPQVRVPAVHRDVSTRRVLVMERFHGRTLARGAARRTEPSSEEVARALLAALLDQILRDGVFHADLHQGNIMLLDDGGIGLLDFGSVVRVDAELRAGLRHLLLAVDRAEPRGVTDALLSVVESPAELDRGRLTREVGRCLARHLGPGATAGATLLVDLIRVLTGFGLRVPPELAAAFRAVATLEGALAKFSPGFDAVAEARVIASRVRVPAFEPADVRYELARLVPALRKVPRTIERIGRAVESGRLTLHQQVSLGDADRRRLQDVVHQVLAATVGSALGFMALFLLRMPGGAAITSRLDLHEVLGYGLLSAGAILVARALVPMFALRRT